MDLALSCPRCKKILDEPVVLPCGHTVCKRHERDEIESPNSKDCKTTKKLTCDVCRIGHTIPTNGGFTANILVRSLLERNLAALNLGAEYHAAQTSFGEFKRMMTSLRQILTDPELEVNRVIGELKNQIDLRREEAKQKIDDEALTLIGELDDYEARFRASRSKNSLEVTTNNDEDLDEVFKSLDEDLRFWEAQLKLFNGSARRWHKIHLDSVSKWKIMSDKYEQTKKRLLGGSTSEFEKLELKKQRFCLQSPGGSIW